MNGKTLATTKLYRILLTGGRGGLEPPTSAVIGPERCASRSKMAIAGRGVMWPEGLPGSFQKQKEAKVVGSDRETSSAESLAHGD